MSEAPPVLDKKAAQKLAEQKLLIQMRKDHLAREKALDQVTLNKIKEKWYDTFLSIRIPEMQDNLRHILHYMEKLTEGDDFRNFVMESERDEISEQSNLIAQSHNSALERLCDIYDRRVQDLDNSFKEKVLREKQEAEAEFRAIDEEETVNQENLRTIFYQMEQNRNETEYTITCNMFFKIDDERSRNMEKLENLRAKLEKKMEGRWSEINSTLMEYENNTQHRRSHYLRLKAKDDADMKIINQQMKKTQKLFEQLEHLKKCHENCYATPEKQSLITNLQEERHKLYTSFISLKALVAQELVSHEKKLKLLTVATNTTTNKLSKICKKGEEILTLFRICLKFETQKEKVFPMGSVAPIKETLDGKESKKHHEDKYAQEKEKGDWPREYEILTKFWRKVAKVRLSSLALKKCTQNLQKENALLKDALVKYLKNMSSKGALLNTTNTKDLKKALLEEWYQNRLRRYSKAGRFNHEGATVLLLTKGVSNKIFKIKK